MPNVSIMTALVSLLSGPLPQGPPATGEPGLQEGIRQINDGDLESGIRILDAVILKLAPQGASHGKELAQANLYKGVALVGLTQEESAKASFREALRYEPELRLAKGQFPDRVVRVFEAARQGRTKSVMKRPSGAPKKAGLGVGAVAAIVGGVALAGGAAVAVAANSGPEPSPSPAPTPMPTPDPRAVVTPVSSAGPIQVTFLSSAPPPGSTITGCGGTSQGCLGRLQMTFAVRSDFEQRFVTIAVDLLSRQGGICLAGFTPDPFHLQARESFVVSVSFTTSGFSCAVPAELVRMVASVSAEGVRGSHEWHLSYGLAP